MQSATSCSPFSLNTKWNPNIQQENMFRTERVSKWHHMTSKNSMFFLVASTEPTWAAIACTGEWLVIKLGQILSEALGENGLLPKCMWPYACFSYRSQVFTVKLRPYVWGRHGKIVHSGHGLFLLCPGSRILFCHECPSTSCSSLCSKCITCTLALQEKSARGTHPRMWWL